MRSEFLGKKVKDIVTDFEGIAIGHVQYLTGCDQILVVPKAQDGKAAEGHWYDVNRIEITDANKLSLDTSENKGACDPAPIK